MNTISKQRNLHHCMCSTLRGLNWDPHADLEGFVLRDFLTGQAMYTVYVAPHGYSSYIAINDIHKGIEIEDEKPLTVNVPLDTAVSAIKAHQIKNGFDYYKTAPPVNSMPQRAPHYLMP